MCKIAGFGATRMVVFVLTAGLASTLSCGVPTFLTNYTTSLGGETPGGRGTIQVVVVNNTPFFASFTVGAFDSLAEHDPQNVQNFLVQYQSFVSDPALPDSTPLAPNTDTDTSNLGFSCSREISLGDRVLIQAIRERDPNAILSTLDPEDEGITFSDKLPTDETAQKFTLNGVANQVQLLGVNYQCESLVVFTFELDASQPFGVRIDASVVLP